MNWMYLSTDLDLISPLDAVYSVSDSHVNTCILYSVNLVSSPGTSLWIPGESLDGIQVISPPPRPRMLSSCLGHCPQLWVLCRGQECGHSSLALIIEKRGPSSLSGVLAQGHSIIAVYVVEPYLLTVCWGSVSVLMKDISPLFSSFSPFFHL